MPYEAISSKVYFGAGFHPHSGRDHAGSRLNLDCHFSWDGTLCRVPAIYLCAGGLVLDLLVRVEPEQIARFTQRWGAKLRTDTRLSSDEQLLCKADDPFSPDIIPRLIVNGKALTAVRVDSVRFNPHPDCCPPTMPEADTLTELYGCDRSCGWLIVRASFLWATRKKPALHSLSLTLEHQPRPVPGVHFIARYAGQQFVFTHPFTGNEHRLTVLSVVHDTPGRTHLTCALTPDLPSHELLICDSRAAVPEAAEPALLRTSDAMLHEAFSDPPFVTGEAPEWKLVFCLSRSAPVSLILMDDRRF